MSHHIVEFKNVSFRYPGAEDDVLKNITFTARPGQTTAFIGSTGSGKSTLIDLIPRFYDVTAGQVLVDGSDVRDVSQHDLREKIGYVSQKAVLFSGSSVSFRSSSGSAVPRRGSHEMMGEGSVRGKGQSHESSHR